MGFQQRDAEKAQKVKPLDSGTPIEKAQKVLFGRANAVAGGRCVVAKTALFEPGSTWFSLIKQRVQSLVQPVSAFNDIKLKQIETQKLLSN